MKNVSFAGLDAVVAGGTDREGGGTGPVVVLLHGFGAPGDDLVPLWRTIRAPGGTRFVFPEAPLDLGAAYGHGRAWWRIDLDARMRLRAAGVPQDVDEVPPGLDAARAKIDALLGEVEATLRPLAGKVVLGGFSQGAVLSLDAALRTPHALAGLVLLSGTHIAAKEWAGRLESRRNLPVFMSHGHDDPILPFSVDEALRDTLLRAGLPVEWVHFRGGHGIPPEVLDKAGAFVERVLRGSVGH